MRGEEEEEESKKERKTERKKETEGTRKADSALFCIEIYLLAVGEACKAVF